MKSIIELLNFFFNLIFAACYIFFFLFILRFMMTNNRIIINALSICFILFFPILSMVFNNLFFKLIKYKKWKGWLKIPIKFNEIFFSIEMGYTIIVAVIVILLMGINKEKIIYIPNLNVRIMAIGLILLIIIIVNVIMRIIKKIFVIKKE